ncbi:hypothetical protein [Nannocystis pusilla]|uniref:hypothetical protein n=1 Tax=Nannocystis pusilla TaxID=889268 RepID=UPI003BF1C2C2
MTTQYTIYLVNNSAQTQQFWCFLATPDELAGDPGVFANSSMSLALSSGQPGTNTFTIPVQYVVSAGASNQAVGFGVEIDSSITSNAELGQLWEADYANAPPDMGPGLKLLDSAGAPATAIALQSNKFDEVTNEANHWFSNMSFGIETERGFIGMTWSPSPQQTRTLTPLLKFYVAVGSYGSNTLARWTDISNKSAMLQVPDSFQLDEATVTYGADGGWSVTPGAPPASPPRRSVHDDVARDSATPRVSQGPSQEDTVAAIQWNTSSAVAETGPLTMSGTLTVKVALAASFTAFVLGGIVFKISRAAAGGTTVEFSYSGRDSVDAVKSLFTVGAKLLFS